MGEQILVLGCGELGTEVLSGLCERRQPGQQISVLVREPNSEEKADKIGVLKGKGVIPVFADILSASEDELCEILKNFDTVVSCVGYSMPLGTQVFIAKSVLKAKVKLFVPWQFGVDYDAIGYGSGHDLFDEQLDVRELIRGQSEVDWIIVSTGIFMSFLFEPSFGVIDGKEAHINALGSWDNKLTFTTPRDIGSLTATIVLQGYPRIKNQVVFVAGDTVSFAEVADKVERFYNKTFEKQLLTVPQLEQNLASAPDSIAKYQLVFAKGVGTFWDKKTTFNGENGIEVETVQTYLQSHDPLS